jgi:hypothetical protein
MRALMIPSPQVQVADRPSRSPDQKERERPRCDKTGAVTGNPVEYDYESVHWKRVRSLAATVFRFVLEVDVGERVAVGVAE